MHKDMIKNLFEGQNNTRNFSHIPTKYGNNIRKDIVRSNVITAKDQVFHLVKKDIRTIIDLRLSKEGAETCNSIYPNATVNHLPVAFGKVDFNKINELLAMDDIDKINSFIEDGYRTFCLDFKKEINTFFALLLDERNLPLVFHCSAGKDRTGILSVLFLMALGVSRSDAIKDYLESNNKIDLGKVSDSIDVFFKSKTFTSLHLPEVSSKTFETFFVVRKSWIETFLRGIDNTFGGVEAYFENELQLDTEKLKKIYTNI